MNNFRLLFQVLRTHLELIVRAIELDHVDKVNYIIDWYTDICDELQFKNWLHDMGGWVRKHSSTDLTNIKSS